MAREYPDVPTPTSREPILRAIVEAINKLLRGRGNNVGTFSLRADPNTTTTVANNRIESGMTINLSPLNAAAAVSDWRVTVVATGSFTVQHLPQLSTANFAYEFRG